MESGVPGEAHEHDRDDTRLPYAHRFAPEIWLDERGSGERPLIPFSDGPAICPARNLVQMLSSAMLAALIDAREIRLLSRHALGPDRPLTGTLNHFALRFALSPSGAGRGNAATTGAPATRVNPETPFP